MQPCHWSESLRHHAEHPGPIVVLWISVRDGVCSATELNHIGEKIGLPGLGFFGIEALMMSGIVQGAEEGFEILPQIEQEVREWLETNSSTIEEYISEYRASREQGEPLDDESARAAQQRIADIGRRLRFEPTDI